MTNQNEHKSIGNRIRTALEVLDTAFDPAATDRDRIAALEARVARLEAERRSDAVQG